MIWGRLRYEVIGSLNSNCRNNDIETVIKANKLCATFGIDAIITEKTGGLNLEAMGKQY